MTTASSITLAIPTQFAALCKTRGVTPEQLLSRFIADLAESTGSRGSDERLLATQWFERAVWPEAPLRTYTITARPAELGGGWKLTLYADDKEAGGGVFPVTLNPDPQVAMQWWAQDLDEASRRHWKVRAGNAADTEAGIADMYRNHLVELAREDLEREGELWVNRGARPGE